MSGKPQPGEYGEYFGRYISLVETDDVAAALQAQLPVTMQLLDSVTEEQSLHRYEPGKWSIREMLGHMGDTERVMAYRALTFARGDAAVLPSFDQDLFTANAGFNSRSWESLKREFAAVRAASVALFDNLSPEAWTRGGTASGKPTSVRALAYIIAGHELYHRVILRERYGVA